MEINLIRSSHPSRKREKGENLRKKSEKVVSLFFNDEMLWIISNYACYLQSLLAKLTN